MHFRNQLLHNAAVTFLLLSMKFIFTCLFTDILPFLQAFQLTHVSPDSMKKVRGGMISVLT